MGAAQSAAFEHRNGDSGRDADFTYRRDVEPGERILSYTSPSSADGQSIEIRTSDVIAVMELREHNPKWHRHLMIHTRMDTKSKSSTQIPALEYLVCEGLPAPFVKDFSLHESIRTLAEKRQLHFVVSTGSGTKMAQPFFESTIKPLLVRLGYGEGVDYSVEVTKSEETITELATTSYLRLANEGKALSLVLLSGDGGVVDLVNVFSRAKKSAEFVKPSIRILPFGTGNALSNSYNYNKDDTCGLATAYQGSCKPLPVFRACFSAGARVLVNEGRDEQKLPLHNNLMSVWGAVVFSWGLHASLVADSDTSFYRQFGAERFQMAARALLSPEDGSGHHKYNGIVSVKGTSSDLWRKLERSEHSYVLATLVSHLEKTFNVSPASADLDGRLRLIEMPALSGERLMELMMAGYQDGKHIGAPEVGYQKINALRIDFNEADARWRRVCIDGKIIQVEKGGWAEMQLEEQSVLDMIYMPPDRLSSGPPVSSRGKIYRVPT